MKLIDIINTKKVVTEDILQEGVSQSLTEAFKHLVQINPNLRVFIGKFMETDWCKNLWEAYHEVKDKSSLNDDFLIAYKSFFNKEKYDPTKLEVTRKLIIQNNSKVEKPKDPLKMPLRKNAAPVNKDIALWLKGANIDYDDLAKISADKVPDGFLDKAKQLVKHTFEEDGISLHIVVYGLNDKKIVYIEKSSGEDRKSYYLVKN